MPLIIYSLCMHKQERKGKVQALWEIHIPYYGLRCSHKLIQEYTYNIQDIPDWIVWLVWNRFFLFLVSLIQSFVHFSRFALSRYVRVRLVSNISFFRLYFTSYLRLRLKVYHDDPRVEVGRPRSSNPVNLIERIRYTNRAIKFCTLDLQRSFYVRVHDSCFVKHSCSKLTI